MKRKLFMLAALVVLFSGCQEKKAEKPSLDAVTPSVEVPASATPAAAVDPATAGTIKGVVRSLGL